MTKLDDATIGGAALSATATDAAEMREVSIRLTLGGVEFTSAELRELTAGDILNAQESSEKVVQQRDGTLALVGSPARMGREILRRRVACLRGDGGQKHQGPLSLTELDRMSPEDFKAVQDAADAMDVMLALRAGAQAAARGRMAGGGGQSAESGPLPVSYGPAAGQGIGHETD
jgi:phage FluMu protein gp41